MGSADMATTEKALRASIIAHGAQIVERGLGGAPDGDISARLTDSILITPSGAQYSALRPAMITQMPLAGEYGAWKGPMKPSGEWRVHLDIARARRDIGAIVRIQPPYATALAIAHKSIPAAHSMIALFGSPVIRCSKYAPSGTKELAAAALEALGEDGHAALLANCGALTTGRTLEAAIARAIALESFAKLYAIALSVGRPAILSDDEVARVVERLKSNGADIEARIVGTRAQTKAKLNAKRPAKTKL
jgi:L-fuculose-phosphate aldolase